MALNVLLSGLGVLIKLLCGLITNKVLSVQLGPAAFGVWGNVFSLSTLYSAFSNGGIGQGLVARLSKPEQADISRQRWLAGGLAFALAVPIMIAAFHAAFRQADVVTGSRALTPLLALILALCAAISLHIQSATLANNGAGTNSFVVAVGGMLSLAAYFLLVRPGSVESAARALVVGATLILLLWLIAARATRVPWMPNGGLRQADWHTIRELVPYVGIALAPALVGTAAILAVRATVAAEAGAAAAGLWQGMFRLSDAVIALAQAVVAYVLLPAVFRAESPRRALKGRFRAYALLVGAGYAFGALILWFASAHVVRLLYSDQYDAIAGLLWIELMGDALKALAMPLVTFFIYERRLRLSWGLELLFSCSFLIGCQVLIRHMGLAGAAWAYVAANFALLMVASAVFLGNRDA